MTKGPESVEVLLGLATLLLGREVAHRDLAVAAFRDDLCASEAKCERAGCAENKREPAGTHLVALDPLLIVAPLRARVAVLALFATPCVALELLAPSSFALGR